MWNIVLAVLSLSCIFTIEVARCSGIPTRHYRDCKEALKKGNRYSGVYTIKPDHLPPFDVYCDMKTDGGGWAVFQRRMDGTGDFYLGWADYVKGFGDLNREFWLGLSQINRLTNSGTTKSLRVELEDFDGNKRYAKYSTFRVKDSSRKYQLNVAGYSGNAGNSLATHNGRKFSTKDQDNDTYGGNCAKIFKGAWWYAACHHANLNGKYLSGAHASFADGVNWYHMKGYNYSLKISEMKIR